ncbi:MAG: N-glycosylase, partial [Candidatus Hydrothermarchaeota archaeon]
MKMKKLLLLKSIRELKNSEVKKIIVTRIKEFKDMRDKPSNEIFKELCFCILTANFNAEKSIKIQEKIDDGFLTLPEEKLAEELKKLGHRFPKTRAKYIIEARKHLPYFKDILNREENSLREWLVKNVKGLGY